MKKFFPESLRNALVVVMMAAIWVLFAPVQFGGTASYVIVAGASMEPALQQGDLVIARSANTYAVGDVVTYMHPRVGPVIHRIIERQGRQYILKGDNNDWTDSYEPVPSEVLGKSWLQIPGAASKLLWLRSPTGLSLLSLSIGLMFIITISRSREHDEAAPLGPGEDMFARWIKLGVFKSLEGWIFPLGIILFGSVLLGIFAFTKPLTQSIPDDIQYEHRASFSYEAPAFPSLYTGQNVQTGEAVFHTLVTAVDLSYAYSLSSQVPSDVQGTSQISLRISEPNGWKREFPLIPEQSFSGSSYTEYTTIDLDQIIRYLDWVQDRTGLERRVFNLDVIVETKIAGFLDDQPFSDQFASILQFKLDELQLYVDGQSPLTEDIDPLNPVETHLLPRQRVIDNTLDIFGIELTVNQARRIASVAGGTSLFLILVFLAPGLIASTKSESIKIQLQHREMLMDVYELPDHPSQDTVVVERFDDLAKVAQMNKALILHFADNSEHTYVVHDGETVYTFSFDEQEPEDVVAAADPEQSETES